MLKYKQTDGKIVKVGLRSNTTVPDREERVFLRLSHDCLALILPMESAGRRRDKFTPEIDIIHVSAYRGRIAQGTILG